MAAWLALRRGVSVAIILILAAILPTSSARPMPLIQMKATSPQVLLVRGFGRGFGRGFHGLRTRAALACMAHQIKADWCPPNGDVDSYETGGRCVVQSGRVVEGSCLVLIGTDCTIKNGTLVAGTCFAVTPEQGMLLAVLGLILAFLGFCCFAAYRNRAVAYRNRALGASARNSAHGEAQAQLLRRLLDHLEVERLAQGTTFSGKNPRSK